MDICSTKKCTKCGEVKGELAFSNKGGQYTGRNTMCRSCVKKRRTAHQTLSTVRPDRSPAPFLWNQSSWDDDMAWHIAHNKQQDLMRRDIPDYPSNTTIFAPVGGWNDRLRPQSWI